MSRAAGGGAAGGRACGWFAVVVWLGLASSVASAASPEVALELPHGGWVEGRFGGPGAKAADGTATVRVETPTFAGPLDVCVDAFERLLLLPHRSWPERRAAWRVHLRGGDAVAGDLDGLDGERLRVTLAGAGAIALRRRDVVRIERIVPAAEVVPGDNKGMMTNFDGFSSVGGRMVCAADGGTGSRNVPVAARAVFDVELSWRERPDFDVTFASEQPAGEEARTAKPAAEEVYRVEATGGVVRGIREAAAATTREVATIPPGPGGLALRVFIDQRAGRMAVGLPTVGAKAAAVFDATEPPRRADGEPRGGFSVRLRRGDLCIERLRVVPWEADTPRLDEASIGGAAEVVESFDAATSAFVVRTGDATRRVAADDVVHVWLGAGDADAPPRDAVVAVLADGSRLTGELLGCDRGITLACPAVEEPLTVDFARLAAIEAVRVGDVRGLPGTIGRLDDGTDSTMLGCLTDVGGVGWHALGAVSPVAFAGPDVAARIAYRGLGALGGVGVHLARQGDDAWEVVDITPGGPAARDGRLRVGDRVTTIAQNADGEPVTLAPRKLDTVRALLRGPVGSTVRLGVVRGTAEEPGEIGLARDETGCDDLAGAAPKDVLDRAIALEQSLVRAAVSGGPATVHLLNGDAVACALVSATADQAVVQLAPDHEVRVPTRLVRAVELLPVGVRPLLKQKLARLLTVPRAQQAAPPTHVLRLAAGDYLRGRLVAVDAKIVRFDVAGEVKELPRRDVARIIRLVTADERPPAPRAALAGLPGLPVVAVGSDGRRLAIAATGVAGGAVVGTSPAFGAMRIPLARCAELLVGGAIDEHAPEELPYAQWVLTPAPAPGR